MSPCPKVLLYYAFLSWTLRDLIRFIYVLGFLRVTFYISDMRLLLTGS